ncbi:MAG TPA: hypothetical protein VHM25_21870 [Polyangiaceae bacterium]|nr:hypothetical protein [Polyangiaceae bacterium]
MAGVNWRRDLSRYAELMLGMLLCLGCSTTSTIARIHEGPIEGDIVGSSADSIFVERDSGDECEIKRDDISSIDYPGNVHRNVGIGVALYGALNIALGMPKCEERTDDKAAFCTGVFIPAAIGIGLITWGLLVQHGQTSAAAAASRPSAPPNGRAGTPIATRPCPVQAGL